MSKPIDIGHGVTIRFWTWYGHDGEHGGLIETHQKPDGTPCEGSITFDTPLSREKRKGEGPFWAVHSLDPLTISPSVMCTQCGHHGFIRAGKWCPA